MLKSVSLNTLYQLIGKGISLILGLAIISLLTHALDQQSFGRYTLITTLIVQIAAISDWGTGFIAVRAASQSKFPTPLLFTNLLYLRLAYSLLGVLILLILKTTQAFDISSALYNLAIIALLATNIKNVFLSVFQAKLKFSYLAATETSVNLIYYIFLILVISNPTLHQALTLLTISILGGLIISLYFVFKLTNFDNQFQFPIIKYLIKESLPMGGQLFIFNVYNRIDIYFLQYFHGEAAVAIYGLSYKLYENVILGAAYLMNSLFPLLSQASTTSRRKLFQHTSHFMLISGISLCILLIITAPYLIRLINDQYHASILPLQILSFGLIFTYMNHLAGYSLASINRQAVFFKIALIGLIINLVMNFTLIPRYFYYAAAWSTVATEATIMVFSLWFLHSQQYQIKLTTFPQSLQILKQKFTAKLYK